MTKRPRLDDSMNECLDAIEADENITTCQPPTGSTTPPLFTTSTESAIIPPLFTTSTEPVVSAFATVSSTGVLRDLPLNQISFPNPHPGSSSRLPAGVRSLIPTVPRRSGSSSRPPACVRSLIPTGRPDNSFPPHRNDRAKSVHKIFVKTWLALKEAHISYLHDSETPAPANLHIPSMELGRALGLCQIHMVIDRNKKKNLTLQFEVGRGEEIQQPSFNYGYALAVGENQYYYDKIRVVEPVKEEDHRRGHCTVCGAQCWLCS